MKFNYAKIVLIPYSNVGYSSHPIANCLYEVYLPAIMASMCIAYAAGDPITVQYGDVPTRVEIFPFFKSEYPRGEKANSVYEFAQDIVLEKSEKIRWIFGHERDLRLLHQFLTVKQFLNVQYCEQQKKKDNRFEITFNEAKIAA